MVERREQLMDVFESAINHKTRAALERENAALLDTVTRKVNEKIEVQRQLAEARAELERMRGVLGNSPAPVGDVREALAEAISLLTDLDQGRSIHNSRFRDQQIDGPLWAQVSRVVGLCKEALTASPIAEKVGGVTEAWSALFDRYGHHDDGCDMAKPDCSCGMRTAYRAALASAPQLGWRLLPEEPTEAMAAAGHAEWNRLRAGDPVLIYRAMLAAAPAAPVAPVAEPEGERP